MAGIYIHIPFCKQKCHYCNFFSLASSKMRDEFIDALMNEIYLQRNYLVNETVETIYFGGGTPSLLSPDELNKLFDQLHKYFSIDSSAEITLEANPDDLNPVVLNKLAITLVNRLSIGIQSFRDEDLHYLNRVHTGEQAHRAVKQSIDAGFSNLSIDLIYGIPTLETIHWTDNLRIASALDIKHLSAYALTIEPKTPLEILIRKKKAEAPDEEKMVEQFMVLMDFARKNRFVHYEISNLCRESYYSKHNTNYWNGEKYLGLGPSAHSFDGSSRQWNVASLNKYVSSLAENSIPAEKEVLTTEQKYNELVMVSLRTIWGVDLKKINELFGEKLASHFLNSISPFVDSGKAIQHETVYTLTDEGKLFADKISSELFI